MITIMTMIMRTETAIVPRVTPAVPTVTSSLSTELLFDALLSVKVVLGVVV